MRRKLLMMVGCIALVLEIAGSLLPGMAVQQAVYTQQAEEWSTPLNISHTSTESQFPAIATDRAGQVHVLWSEYSEGYAGDWPNMTYYTMWDGIHWSDPVDVLLSPGGFGRPQTGYAMLPSVAVDSDGKIHVIWSDTYTYYYSWAWANGKPWRASSWSYPFVLNPTGGRGLLYNDLYVDGDEEKFHVVWSQTGIGGGGNFHIAYLSSADGGHNWSFPVEVSDGYGGTLRARLAMNGDGTIHVAWEMRLSQALSQGQNEGQYVYYSRSMDGGQSWSPYMRIDTLSAETFLVFPVPAIDRMGRVFLFWNRPIARETVFRKSEDGGASWSPPEVLPVAKSSAGDAALKDVAYDSVGVIHLVLAANEEGSTSSNDIYHLTWDGYSWSAPVNVSRSLGVNSRRPKIAVSEGNRLHVVWWEEEGDIYYSSSLADAPAIPPRPWPALEPTPTSTRSLIATATTLTTPTPTLPVAVPAWTDSGPLPGATSQSLPLLVGVGTALICIISVVVTRIARRPPH